MHPSESRVPPLLIVDADAAGRTAVAQALLRAGFGVETSVSGGEALALLRQRRFSLVLIDGDCRRVEGLDLLQSVKRTTPGLPIIVMSAHGTVAGAVEALQAGASDFLLKPSPAEVLAAAVRRAANRGAPPAAEPRGTWPQREEKAFVTRDPAMAAVLETARRVAATPSTVLIQGESGTGKELLASFIHRHSADPEGPYVAVNCAALPEALAESELFGHEKGAFTGAFSRKIGKFELARKGTLVLDEIGEMPLTLQAKLLRVLQEKEIDRVGGHQPVPVEVRVIAITNRDLAERVAAGLFREDLYYRVNVVPLVIPPLRERAADILPLAEHFLKRHIARLGLGVRGFSRPAVQALTGHPWKGNVRELENTVERAVILSAGGWVEPGHLGLAPGGEAPAPRGAVRPLPVGTTVWEMERRLIMDTLGEVEQNRTRAAEMLGISIRTLRNKLREYKAGGGAAAV